MDSTRFSIDFLIGSTFEEVFDRNQMSLPFLLFIGAWVDFPWDNSGPEPELALDPDSPFYLCSELIPETVQDFWYDRQ